MAWCSRPRPRRAKQEYPLHVAFQREPWQREWFQSCVDDLKACRFQRFTDNFVLVGANPGNVDWFDDAGWEHRRALAHRRMAREAGRTQGHPLRPRAVSAAVLAVPLRRAAGKRGKLCRLCQGRRRGARRCARSRGIPGHRAVLLFPQQRQARRRAPARAARARRLRPVPAFLDGWLDAAPPTVTFVDGCESAYLYNSAEQYLEATVRMKGECQKFVSPENRAKYRAQVQAGFGIYLDAYWNPPTSPWHIATASNETRADRLGENVAAALRASRRIRLDLRREIPLVADAKQDRQAADVAGSAAGLRRRTRFRPRCDGIRAGADRAAARLPECFEERRLRRRAG